jgi:hypothetical protein
MSIELPCDWKSGFVMDPTRKQRCGYLLAFNGLGLDAKIPDKEDDNYKIRVFTPYNATETKYKLAKVDDVDGQKAIDCVGILDNFSFGGGAGDPICISAYISTEFASQLKAKQKASLSTTVVTKLAWWVVNYDVEEKAWYEEAYPLGTTAAKNELVAGQLNAQGGKDIAMQIAEEPSKIAANIDVQVFQMYFEVVPGSDQTYALNFAQGKTKDFVKGWGLQVGSIAKAKLGGGDKK